MSRNKTSRPGFATSALIAASLFAFTPSEAATFVNGSFEDTSATYAGLLSTDRMSDVAAPGWSVSTNSPDWLFGSPGLPGLPGSTGLWLTPWGDLFTLGASEGTANREGISQTLTGLVIGTTYAINFQQANGLLFDQGSHSGMGNVGGWEVLVDGSSIGTSASTNDNTTPAASFPGSWNLGLATFEATDTSQTIEFLAYGGSASNPTFQFLDDVSIAPIPEPSTTLLAALAALTLTCRCRRLP